MQNASESSRVSNASVKILGALPPYFTITDGVSIPASVQAGDTHTYVVHYAIAGNAPDGIFDVKLGLEAENVDLSAFNQTVRFAIGTTASNGEINYDATEIQIHPDGSSTVKLAIDLFNPVGISSVTLDLDDPGGPKIDLVVDRSVPDATARVKPVIEIPGSISEGNNGHLFTIEVLDAAGNPAANRAGLVFDNSEDDRAGSGDFLDRTRLFGVTGEYAPGTYVSQIIPTRRPVRAGFAEGGSEDVVLHAKIGGGLIRPNVVDDWYAGGQGAPLQKIPLGTVKLEMRGGVTAAAVSAAEFQLVEQINLSGWAFDSDIFQDITRAPFLFGKYFQMRLTITNTHATTSCWSSGCSSPCPALEPSCHRFRQGTYEINVNLETGADSHFITVIKEGNLAVGTGIVKTLGPSAPNVRLTIPAVNFGGNAVGGYFAKAAPTGFASLPPDQALAVRNEADVSGPVEIRIEIGQQSLPEDSWAGMTIQRIDASGSPVGMIDVVVSSVTGIVTGHFAFDGPGDFGVFRVIYPRAPYHTVDSTTLVRGLPEFEMSASPDDAVVVQVQETDPQVAEALTASAAAGRPLASHIFRTQSNAESLGATASAQFRFDASSLAAKSIASRSLRIFTLSAQGAFVPAATQTLNVATQSITVGISTPGIYAIFGTPEATANPSSGQAGTALTITGSGFGVFAGTNTFVTFGEAGPTAAILSWRNTQVVVSAPILTAGAYDVLVIRQVGASTSTVATAPFTVVPASASTGPTLALTPYDGQAIGTPTPLVIASYASDAGVDTSTVRLAVDGLDVTTRAVVGASSASFTTDALSEGSHVAVALAVDVRGSTGTAVSSFLVDTLAPSTTLYINGNAVVGTSTSAYTTQRFTLAASDSGSGVADTELFIDADPDSCGLGFSDPLAAPGTCANPFYGGAFTLAAGTHTVSYFSFDAADNVEILKQLYVTVATDSRGPRTALSAGQPSVSSAALLYATNATPIDFTATDDAVAAGDGAGGSAQIFVSVDSAAFSGYAGPFVVPEEGLHSVSFNSVDAAGNVGTVLTQAVAVDLTPPQTTLVYHGPELPGQPGLVVSTSTVFTLPSVDPVSGGVASGVGPVFFVVDADPFSPECAGISVDTSAPRGTCANEAYAGPFTLSPGTHTVYYLAEDALGNSEDLNYTEVGVRSDAFPPRTALLVGASSSAVGGFFVSSGAVLGLAAVDDAAANGDGAGQVAATYLAVDATSYSLYAGTFTLPSSGPHSIAYFSVDWTGRSEVLRSTMAVVDAEAPTTTLSVSGSSATGEYGLLIADGALVVLSTSDAASGAALTLYAVDEGTQQVYAEPFSLALGTHSLSYSSRDNVGNQELVRVASVTAQNLPFDVLPPRTSFAAGTPRLSSGSLYAAGATTFTLTAADDGIMVGDAAGKGVLATYVALDTGSYAAYSGAFTVPAEGTHTVTFYSVDVASHAEIARSTSLAVDLTSPVSVLTASGPVRAEGAGVQGVSTTTLFLLTAQDPVSHGVASGLGAILYAVDGATAVYSGPFALTPGLHALAYHARDNVGNAESSRIASVSVHADSLPPRTALLVGASSSTAGGLFVTTSAVFGLTAVDDIADIGDASGTVTATYLSVDAAPYALNHGTFTLAAGAHALSYYSVDWTGRAEAPQTTSVTADAAAPVTILTVVGSSAPAVQGGLIISTDAFVTLTATDAASGVSATLFTLDASVEQAYAAPFLLTPGSHTVQYSSVDRLGNRETSQTAFFRVQTRPFDNLPPRTLASVGSPSFAIPGRQYATNASAITLTAVDDGVSYGDGIGKGVAQTLYGVDTTTLAVYSGPFTITSEGAHVVRYRSVDTEGRFEAQRSTTVVVDFTPPQTSILASPSGEDAQHRPLILANQSLVTLSASDPESGGVASGLAVVLYAVDAGTEAAYAAPFSLTSGVHSVYYRARDRLGNAEALHSVEVTAVDASAAVDAQAPTGAITSLVDGSTLTSLSFISGTAADNLVLKEIQLAARDLGTGEWWNGTTSSWTASEGPVYGASSIPGLADTANWSVDVGSGAAGTGFGAFSGFLVNGHGYRVYARAADYAGHVSNPASEAAFVWSGASNTFAAPGRTIDLAAQSTGYLAVKITWTAPGEIGGMGQARAYDLRAATFPITDSNFASAQAVAAPAPSPAGSPEGATFFGAAPGSSYNFALKTVNHAGQTSMLSSIASAYSGDFFAALDPFGRLWQISANQNSFFLAHYTDPATLQGSNGVVDLLRSGSTSRALGFDADGGAYAFFTLASVAQHPEYPRAVLYKATPDGVFIDSTPFFSINGQQSALNAATNVNLAASVDVNGVVWIAGDAGAPGQYAGLWKADGQGLTLAALSSNATAYAVLALGGGNVWMAGTDGELAFWRHDPASGAMTRYNWANTLGGTGSAGHAMVEDAAGNVWIGGWANGAAHQVAALWRWNGTTIELVATSTGAYAEGASGLDLDGAGRFWLSGRSAVDATTPSLALWQYSGSGSQLALNARYIDVPAKADFGVGNALTLAQGSAWALAGPAPYGVRTYALGLGEISGTLNYPDGFTGGNVGFFLSRSLDFNDAALLTLLPAPAFGTRFDYRLTGLLAPATYYIGAIYDLSGSLAATGTEPGPDDPLGLSFTPALAPAGGTGAAADVTLTPDIQAPTLALLSPVDGSTTTASLFSISGTAADDHGVGEVKIGLQNMADGTWWDPNLGTFTVSGQPLTNISAVRSGRADAFSWFVDPAQLTRAIDPSHAYRVYAKAHDISGHSSSASATVTIISTSVPSISTPTTSLAMSRDAAGNFWLVTQDQLSERPVEFTLRKYDSQGVAIASTTLPGASGGDNFKIAFNTAGDAWAVGDGQNGALGLWKVDAADQVLLASAAIANANGALFSGGVAVDASGHPWISAAEQTSGNFSFRLGLWKFNADSSLASGFPVYSQRGGGLDGGLSTAIDPSGNIWSAGVSSNPATGQLDLALWKFNSAGSLISGFPVYRPTAFLGVGGGGGQDGPELDMTISPTGAVWVAASQAYPLFHVSDLALLRYDLSGVLVSSTLWHSADRAVVQGRAVVLDASGNPFVLGRVRSEFGTNASPALWKYTAGGVLAAGFPKTRAFGFDNSLAVDAAATPWVAIDGRPQVFGSTEILPGAPGPGYFATAGLARLSGTLTYPAGFVAGSTITIVASNDGFMHDPFFLPIIASAGTTLPYAVSLVAPATYQILAFVGTNPDDLTPASAVGVYSNYAAVSVTTYSPTAGVDFSLILDTTPPASAIIGFIPGSTVTALAYIAGTTADDVAFAGRVSLAAQDLDNGLWWDAAKQDWVVSTGPVYKLVNAGNGHNSEPLNHRSWLVQAGAGNDLASNESYGGFSDFLPFGHSLRLYEKARDLVGNEQLVPAISSFVWRGPNGAFGPPDAVGNLQVGQISFTSAALTWYAPGEHQNIGQALSYELRYSTYAVTALNFNALPAVTGLPLPPTAFQFSSFTLTGLTPNTRYYVALKTRNHENGLSSISNQPYFTTVQPHVPPRTTIIAGAPSFSTATLYVTNLTTLTLAAVDDLIAVDDGVGEGVARTFLALDLGTSTLYGGAFSFAAEGLHTASFYSVDVATNVEATSTRTIGVDLSFPSSSLDVVGSSITDAQGTLIYSTATVLALIAQDPIVAGVASGVRSILYVQDGTAEQGYDAPFHLAPGTHTLTFSAIDRVAHREAVHTATFTMQDQPFDILPPRTALAAGSPRFSSSTLYATAVTSFGFTAADDGRIAGDGAGRGVARTFVAVDTTTFSAFASTFSLVAEGTHTLTYYSVDLLGRAEAASSATVSVDLTTPLTTAGVEGSSVTDAQGRLFLSTAALIVLTAHDPVSNGVASGVGGGFYAVDADTEQAYAGPFTLAPGAHTVYFHAFDRVANLETVRSATFTVQDQPYDVLPPRTRLVAGAPSFSSTTIFAAAATPFSLLAHDDGEFVGDDAGRGVARTFVAVDSAAFSLYAGTFSIVGEGAHAVAFYSVDFFGRTELVQLTTVFLDATAPISTLQVLGSSLTDSGRLYLSTNAVLALSAVDPGSGGGGAGTAAIDYALDGGSFQAYAVPFSLALGSHTVNFRAVDRVANAEAVHVASFTVQNTPFDVRPPRTHLVAGFPSYSTSSVYGAGFTPFSLVAADDGLIVGDAAGKGAVRSFLAVDGGSFSLYAGTFAVSGEGSHSLSFFSEDADGNAEAAHGAAVAIDLTAPVSTLSALGSSVTNPQGYVLVSTDVPLALSASDPVSSGVAAGLAEIRFTLDTGAEQAYATPFTLSSGTHVIYFHAIDRVANSEAAHVATFTAVIADSAAAPSPVRNLAAQSTGYLALKITWTAPGETADFGQALAYDLRVATFPINTTNFASAERVATTPPQNSGSFEGATFNAAVPASVYYAALKTTNHAGQTSPISNVAVVYSGDFFAALDPFGRLWQISANQSSFFLARYTDPATLQGSNGVVDLLQSASTSRALGFDADGGAYAFFTLASVAQHPEYPRAVLYKATPDGVFIDSTPFFSVNGQQSALNAATNVNLAASVDADGVVWIAGDAGTPGQYAGLWKADAQGLSLAALSAGATAHAVLALGGGDVWMTGTNGELVFWRHDPANGAMTRYSWANTLGGTGSAGRAMVADNAGNVWIGGWANTATNKVAALWRWNGASIELVATSTGVYSDEVFGLDLDAAGRFWLSGRTVIDGAGSVNHAFWQYSASGGTNLVLMERSAVVPRALDFGVGNAISLYQGKAWGLAGPAPFGVRLRTLGFGQLTGSLSYAPGFSGGDVGFFLSPTIDFNGDLTQVLLTAPSAGTTFAYTLTDLAAPATYYVAAIYDLSGALTAGGSNPGPNDPLGFALTPAILAAGASEPVSTISLSPDTQAPTLSLLSPVDGSTTTASLFLISGTAADDHAIGEVKVGLQNLVDGTWWDSSQGTFTVSGQPFTGISATRSGRVDAFSWSVDMSQLRFAIVEGRPYRVYAKVHDVSGHSVSASASVTIVSTSVLSISTPTVSLGMSRDPSGNFWLVSQDQLSERPFEFTLRKYDSQGVATASTTLPGASGGDNFKIAFNAAGDAWAVGDGLNGALGLWKVDAADRVLLASTTIVNPNGGLFSGGVAVDASGHPWVSLAEQTGPNFTFRLVLWTFNADATVAASPVYFQRGGGLDGGLSTAIDPSGNIWSAGVSSNPATGQLDLALWKFTPAGGLAAGFPVYRSTAFLGVGGGGGQDGPELDMTISPAGAVWVAASQAYPLFHVSDLALLRYDLSGVLVSSTLWHSADRAVVQGRAVSLDASGNPFVVGRVRSGSGTDASPALWKYTAGGVLAAGYPKTRAFGFDNSALAVDAAATPWVAIDARPQVFGSILTLPGAPGPGYFATANFAQLSGTLNYPAGFIAGSTITLVASNDGFRHDPAFFPIIASGGTSLAYAVSLVAPATYQILAFVGTNPDDLTPASAVGVYSNYAAVSVTTYSPTAGIDFSLILDTTPPASAITGFIPGSTVTALASIAGTAADDVAFAGRVSLAAQDLDNGLWWDAAKQDWVVSTGPVYKLINAGNGHNSEPLNHRSWVVQAGAGSDPASNDSYGGFSDFLPFGHSLRLYEKARDLVGNEQLVPTISSFVWRGPNGAFGPPDAVGNLFVGQINASSAAFTWNAPGEHQNIGQALSYDLRYSTYGVTELNFNALPNVTGLPLPPTAFQLSSFTLTGLQSGTTYFVALKTRNHENGLSALSNVPRIVTGRQPAAVLISIAVRPSSMTILSGATAQFAADGIFSDGSTQTLTGSAVWSADAPSVATVTASGLVTALSAGAANISASSGALSAQATLTVANSDALPPVVSLLFSTPSFTAGSGAVTIGTQSLVALSAVDYASGVTPSGVASIRYSIDATTPTIVYAAPFTLSVGAHVVYFSAVDAAGNASAVSSASLSASASPFAGEVLPSTGPIGVGFAIGGFGFGAYAGENTRAKFGAVAAPLSVWSDGAIAGTVPGLSTGAYALSVEVQIGTTVATTAPLSFRVTGLSTTTLSLSSGPIGVPFTITGVGFGAYAGANTRVLISGATAPLSVWNDTTISGTIPGVSSGPTTVVVQRATADGGLVASDPMAFMVTVPSITSVTPASGPIGAAFTLSGLSFGPYAGTNTRVLVAGATAALSVWNDTTISGTIPGSVAIGTQTVIVERVTADGGLVRAATAYFQVTGLALYSLSPATGPIGVPFTINGVGFGAYAGANTRVKFGVSTAALSVWNDTTISGTVPSLSTGVYAVAVERQEGASIVVSNTSTFTVTLMNVASVSPSSGPIGAAFTVTGTSFGSYAGLLTQVLLGGATTPLSVWNDTTIVGTVPGSLLPGVQALIVERRTSDGGLIDSNTAYFTVTGLSVGALSPSSGPIGVPFTISGTSFGAYDGTNTRVRFGISTAALSAWSDTTISGTVPALDTGAWAVAVERQQGSSVSSSTVATFTVTGLSISSISPSSGPIGTAFTLLGPGFGPYAGANTVVLLGGTTAALSVWNDAQIVGTVPGSIPTGSRSVVVRRVSGAGISDSAPASFTVTGMTLAMVAPSSGPIGAPFTITGSQFGTYGGANTRVRIGGIVAALSVWNDTTISGTIPALTTGTVDVVVERQQGADVALSNLSSFTVLGLSPTDVTPSSGPIGTAFTIHGSGFGPYAGANTRAVMGGVVAALSVWNDSTIIGTVPGALAPGLQPVWIERSAGNGVQSSDTGYFTITVPAVASLTPSSAPIGAPFTITGINFGAYAGANTRVKFNGAAAPLSVWNETTISGTVPGSLSSGPLTVVVERAADAGLSSSATQAFLVLVPSISTISPVFGPAGTVVTLSGTGFGPYAGGLTRVLVGGATVPLSVWNDSTINWTVPSSLANGEYPVIVERSPVGGTVDSASATFTVGTGFGGAALFSLASAQPLAAKPDSHFQGDMNLSAIDGGRIETPAKAAVQLPQNALERDTEITLRRLRSDGLRTEAAAAAKVRAAGEPIEFGPEGTRFNTPVTIELPYDPALVADESQISIHYYDPLRRVWEALPSVVDRTRHVVKAQTAHFSIYQPMGLAPTTVAQDEFYYRDQYAFPNPSRGGGAVTFRIQPGLAETVEVRVYDISGRKIHESSDFTFLGGIDDGNGKGVQDTYDHVWGVSGVGSGVYTYVIKASHGGQKPIVKSGKVGIIK